MPLLERRIPEITQRRRLSYPAIEKKSWSRVIRREGKCKGDSDSSAQIVYGTHSLKAAKRPPRQTAKPRKGNVRDWFGSILTTVEGEQAAEVASLAALFLNSRREQIEKVRIGLEFDYLSSRWRQETAHISSVQKKAVHRAYQRIIGMGAAVVPFILKDLNQTHDDWFWALTAITGENPIANEIAGDISKMTEAWIEWGRVKGYGV